jgi:nucleoside-diphosphate-sugar epimerase
MKILVTGAAGFIGRHLVTHLAARHEVIALTRSEVHAASNKQWATVAMDLAGPLETRRLPTRIDAIISLAQANVTFPESADSLFAVNTAAVQHLLDYAKRAEIRRFVLASTGDVYGTRSGMCRESDDVFPKSFYAVTKYAAELLTAPYSDYFQSCVLRLFQPYGPGQSGRLLQRLAECIRHGQSIRLNQEGRPLLSPIYITDVTTAFETASQCDYSGVLNVAGETIVAYVTCRNASARCWESRLSSRRREKRWVI